MIQNIANEITEVKEKIQEFKQIGRNRSLSIEEELDLEELEMDLEDLYDDLIAKAKEIEASK